MKWLVLSLALFPLAAPAEQAVPAAPSDAEIAAATLPLPEKMRAGAAVVRLDAAGKPVPVRAGSNGMVCIADAPGNDEFDVRCYHESFIDVVYRGFQLRRQPGFKGNAGATIEAELKAGTLKMNRQPTAGYRCLGPIADYDAAHNSYRPPIECWQSVHFPYRTAAELGLLDESQISEAQTRHIPYVMSSGKYWSHVMIQHPDPSTP